MHFGFLDEILLQSTQKHQVFYSSNWMHNYIVL